MKYARKRDANEGPIVDALRAAGATVTQLNDAGCPDLLVGWRRGTYLIEVKDGVTKTRVAHRRNAGIEHPELTPEQIKWWTRWKGKMPAIVTTPIEALRAIGAVA